MKRHGQPQACPHCKRRVPRSAARCPWCLGAGVASGKAAPSGTAADSGAAGSPAEPQKVALTV